LRIGIIGTGNMGRVLAEALIESKAVPPSSMMITNRTKAKAYMLKNKYNKLQIYDDAQEVAAHSDLIFVCVKPLDVLPVLQGISPYLTQEKCVVSITSPISTEHLEKAVICSAARVIPSITNRALSGVSLITFADNCSAGWKREIENLLSKFSVPVKIEEKVTRVASDIVSCGPAFFSFLIQRFIDAAVKETEIDNNTATVLAGEMIIGLGELLKQGHFTLPTLQEKVCVKGGITGEGIKSMENDIGEMFEHVFRVTQEKFKEDIEKVNHQFSAI